MSEPHPSPSPARIAPLAVLPVFMRLAGRRVVLAGGSAGAAWKAELVAAAGAQVQVFAPNPSSEMAELKNLAGISLLARPWQPEDLPDAALAVGDFETDEEARTFADAAHAAGVVVNTVDKPAFCDVQFGSVVNRSPLVVGISTDGAAPVFGQAVRARIETLLPAGFQRWAEAAYRWRPLVQARALPFQARRRIWERFTALALASPERPPTDADREALIAAVQDEAGEPARQGSVVLVGAGPGDPELLTLKAVRALQSADVILHDDLVSGAVLDFARREARRMVVGKRGGRPSCRQDDINRLMVTFALAGKRVVRLKGGDPMIFGRAGEEIRACRAAGVPIEIVPGVTAAFGAAASIEASLTHRDHARRVQFVTAHARDGSLPGDLDWSALADPAATTAVYMGKAVLAEFARRVVEAGLPPDTPAVMVENATRSDERIFYEPVGQLSARLDAERVEGPCVMLIGAAMVEAVGHRRLADAGSADEGSGDLVEAPPERLVSNPRV